MKNKIAITLVVCMVVTFLSLFAVNGAIANNEANIGLVYGDANLDGKTNMGDVIKVERFILGLDGMPPQDNVLCGDLNHSGILDMGDVIRIVRYIVGLDSIPFWWYETQEVGYEALNYRD